jgi:hypothetical protein
MTTSGSSRIRWPLASVPKYGFPRPKTTGTMSIATWSMSPSDGIPEIVVDGETGYLIDYDTGHSEEFTRVLAARIEELLADPALAARMGRAGRERAIQHFDWPAIAERTIALYDSLLERRSVAHERLPGFRGGTAT